MRNGLGVISVHRKPWPRFAICRDDEFWAGELWVPNVHAAVLYADFNLAVNDCIGLWFERKPKLIGDEGQNDEQ